MNTLAVRFRLSFLFLCTPCVFLLVAAAAFGRMWPPLELVTGEVILLMLLLLLLLLLLGLRTTYTIPRYVPLESRNSTVSINTGLFLSTPQQLFFLFFFCGGGGDGDGDGDGGGVTRVPGPVMGAASFSGSC